MKKARKAKKKAGYSHNVRKHVAKHVKNIHAFFGISGSTNQRVWQTAKVGVVTALVGGIFKAISLTRTFPQPFDTIGNVILFIAFLIMLSAFLLGRL